MKVTFEFHFTSVNKPQKDCKCLTISYNGLFQQMRYYQRAGKFNCEYTNEELLTDNDLHDTEIVPLMWAVIE